MRRAVLILAASLWGELDYAVTPARGGGRCAKLGGGTFEGTFAFTGENEYVKFEADRDLKAQLIEGSPLD